MMRNIAEFCSMEQQMKNLEILRRMFLSFCVPLKHSVDINEKDNISDIRLVYL